VFTAAGFRILHPQQWSFARQVALYQRAEIIAGAEGSALHNSVFVRPGTPVINVGTPRRNSGLTLNQRMCDSLSGAQSHFLPFAGTASRGECASYDIDVLRARLLALLGDVGA
jgi:capsular polysaccharide biosynthesis protein